MDKENLIIFFWKYRWNHLFDIESFDYFMNIIDLLIELGLKPDEMYNSSFNILYFCLEVVLF